MRNQILLGLIYLLTLILNVCGSASDLSFLKNTNQNLHVESLFYSQIAAQKEYKLKKIINLNGICSSMVKLSDGKAALVASGSIYLCDSTDCRILIQEQNVKEIVEIEYGKLAYIVDNTIPIFNLDPPEKIKTLERLMQAQYFLQRRKRKNICLLMDIVVNIDII